MTDEPGLPLNEIVKVVSEPFGATLTDAWFALLGDKVSRWRLRNAAKTQAKLHEELSRLGLKLSSRVPDRYAFAWFEEASKQDEPEIQILFARLLARAAAGEEEAQDRRLIGILSQLTPPDAAVFQRIYSDQPFPDTGVYTNESSLARHAKLTNPGWPRDWALKLLQKFHHEDASVALEHLDRLGLIEAVFVTEARSNAPQLYGPAPGQKIEFTRLIRELVVHRPYIRPTELGIALAAAVKE